MKTNATIIAIACVFLLTVLPAAAYTPVNPTEDDMLSRLDRIASGAVQVGGTTLVGRENYENVDFPLPLRQFSKNVIGSSQQERYEYLLRVDTYDATTTWQFDGYEALVTTRFSLVYPLWPEDVKYPILYASGANDDTFLSDTTIPSDWNNDEWFFYGDHLAPLWLARVLRQPVTITYKQNSFLEYCEKTAPDQDSCPENALPLIDDALEPRYLIAVLDLATAQSAAAGIYENYFGISEWGGKVVTGLSMGARTAVAYSYAYSDAICTFAASGVNSWDDQQLVGFNGVLTLMHGRGAVAYAMYDSFYHRDSWATVHEANQYRSVNGLPLIDFEIVEHRTDTYRGHHWPMPEGVNWIAGCLRDSLD